MSKWPERGRILLEKARGDQQALASLAKDGSNHGWVLGFHAEQAVEKAIKAVLTAFGVEYPFTHDLLALVEVLRAGGIADPPEAESLGRLTPFGAAWRYEDPVDDTIAFDAAWAQDAVGRTIAWAASLLAEPTMDARGEAGK
ncbi:MAG: HEPN domain-containing protein [Candidatus Coatesbacteria bacterium]